MSPSAGTPARAVESRPAGERSPAAAALPWDPPRSELRRTSKPSSPDPARATPPDALAVRAVELKFSPASAAWLGAWEQEVRGGGRTTALNVADFSERLAEEKAAVDPLLSLLRATLDVEDHAEDRHHSPYPPVSGAVARQAVSVGAAQIRTRPSSHYATITKIAPLIERLWYGPEPDARAVQLFYSVLADGERETSPDGYRGRVGAMEALMRQRRYPEALTASDALVGSKELNSGQVSDAQWWRGVLFYRLGRYAEAVPPLVSVSQANESGHCVEALNLLMTTYVRLDRRDDVKILYERWHAKAMPTAYPTLVNDVETVMESVNRSGS